MRTSLVTASVVFLVASLASCGGGDPRELASDGRTALAGGDAKGALAKFDAAREKTQAGDPTWLNATLGRCVALAKLDPEKAKSEFLALANARPADVKEQDFSELCSALVRAKALKQAADVMDAGVHRFTESPAMVALKEQVASAIHKSADPDALKHLNGLGYTGSDH